MKQINKLAHQIMYLSIGSLAITLAVIFTILAEIENPVSNILTGCLIVVLAISKLCYELSTSLPAHYQWHKVYPELKEDADTIDKQATHINRFLYFGSAFIAVGFGIGLITLAGLILACTGSMLIIVSYFLNASYRPPRSYHWEMVFPELMLGDFDDENES